MLADGTYRAVVLAVAVRTAPKTPGFIPVWVRWALKVVWRLRLLNNF